MSKRKKKIPEKLKQEIEKKLFAPDCVVPDISRSYGIARTTLYKWRSKARKQGVLSAPQVTTRQCVSPVATRQFIELSIEEPVTSLKAPELQKASLTFEDFSLSIEGKVSSSKFMSILKLLEEPC